MEDEEEQLDGLVALLDGWDMVSPCRVVSVAVVVLSRGKAGRGGTYALG